MDTQEPTLYLKPLPRGGVLGDTRGGLPLPNALELGLPKELLLPQGLPTPAMGEGGEGL